MRCTGPICWLRAHAKIEFHTGSHANIYHYAAHVSISLFVGGDLPTMDDYSLQLLTSKEMLACNQNGECGRNVHEKDGIEVWLVAEKNKPGNGWLGIFNRINTSQTVELTREQLGLMKFVTGNKLVTETKTIHLTEIWKNQQFDLKEPLFKLSVDGNDVCFFRFKV